MKKNTLKQILQPGLALVGALLLSTTAAFAEPEPSPSPSPTPGPEAPQVLPETVVTAKPDSLTNPSISSLREQVAETVGAGEIIDAETYKRGRSTTLKDALDFAPGVFVQLVLVPRRRVFRSVVRVFSALSTAVDSNSCRMASRSTLPMEVSTFK
jgi:hypothetical protein